MTEKIITRYESGNAEILIPDGWHYVQMICQNTDSFESRSMTFVIRKDDGDEG